MRVVVDYDHGLNNSIARLREALGDAAGAMDVASAETIGAGMGALGGACKDCHSTYRAPS